MRTSSSTAWRTERAGEHGDASRSASSSRFELRKRRIRRDGRPGSRRPRRARARNASARERRRAVPSATIRPRLEHDDPVGAARELERVRDEDRRAALHQPLEPLEELRLGLRVERRRRLVQQQDRRVAEQRPGDPDPLALAAGETDALGPELRLVAVRQRDDELVSRRRPGRLVDRLGAHVRAVGDVLPARCR